MRINKSVVITAVLTAVVSCLATNTVRDLLYIKDNAKVMRKVSAVTKVIKDYSIYPTEDEELADAAAAAMAFTVDDPYTVYYGANAFRQYQDSTSSSYFGIGLTLQRAYGEEKVTVSECIEGGPSARAGVLANDVLISVDDMECNAENLDEVITYIKSHKAGETVMLHLERNGEALDIEVPLETVQSVMVTGQMIDDKTGYIKIKNFERSADSEARTAYDDFMDRVNELRDSGMSQLVIDLRNNPGGDLGVVTKIADEFLTEGLITYTEDKNGQQSKIYARDGGMDYPVAIITNGSSASASEVLTGALKDNKKAIVVGEKTFGKGVVQNVIPFADGSGMTVTIAKYFTPSGVCIHGIGIEPDVECALPSGTTPDDYTISDDPQIAKAVEVLNK